MAQIKITQRTQRVLIVGRPNVGKSSLFNRLIRQRSALVVNQPGVTRDILKQRASWWGVDFEVWDSGGLWSEDSAYGKAIDKKVKTAIQESDLILCIMDGRAGMLEEDKKTFHLVKKSGKPFLVLINKVDEQKKEALVLSDFYSLGANLLPCAFEKDRGVSSVVEWILSQTGQAKSKPSDTLSSDRLSSDRLSLEKTELQNKARRLLIIGKTNVGKSSLCNALLKQDRILTSPKAGVTVDVVSDQFQYGENSYILSDTAGKTKFAKGKIQSLAELKTHQSFKKADLILLLVDYSVGPSRQDAELLNLCIKEHKAVIVTVNKWDLAMKTQNRKNQNKNNQRQNNLDSHQGALPKNVSYSQTKSEYRKNIQDKFRFYPDLPVVFVSALRSYGLKSLMKKVEEFYQKLHLRVPTSELNRFFTQVIRKAPAPVYGTQDVKLYYLTQTKKNPPGFIAFANYPQGIRNSYHRFLIRQIQNKWNLKGIPIRISFLSRS